MCSETSRAYVSQPDCKSQCADRPEQVSRQDPISHFMDFHFELERSIQRLSQPTQIRSLDQPKCNLSWHLLAKITHSSTTFGQRFTVASVAFHATLQPFSILLDLSCRRRCHGATRHAAVNNAEDGMRHGQMQIFNNLHVVGRHDYADVAQGLHCPSLKTRDS